MTDEKEHVDIVMVRSSDEEPKLQTVPHVRTIQHGKPLLHNARFNKGLAFTMKERHQLRLTGLLPPVVVTQDQQVQRVRHNLSKIEADLDKYIYLVGLQDRNEKLFYRVLCDYVDDLMPIVYTPTVGLACRKFGHIFRSPQGLYISILDKGHIADILRNWPERHVRAIVFTDGERILGLGDLGANGMGIPVGKLSLYTACGGVDPTMCLPVTLDVGTENKELLEDPLYIGLRRNRTRGQLYDEFVDEFIRAVKTVFGPYTLLQFEDFGNSNAFRLLEKYKDQCCTFNDDIQGTAAVALAGIIGALPLTGRPLREHRFLFYGAGEAGLGIATLIAQAICDEDGVPFAEASKNIWLVDSKGLIYKDRAGLTHEKTAFAHPHDPIGTDLLDIVKDIKPTGLIGVTAQPNTFTPEVLQTMATFSERPIIFALSNPTSKAECSAAAAYENTKGQCIFASGSPFPPYKFGDVTLVPGQGNNAYIFPGMGLAVVATGARRVTERMFLIAARAVAQLVTDDDRKVGLVYPPLKDIRKVSLHLATALAKEIYDLNLATCLPRPHDLAAFIQRNVYSTKYDCYEQPDIDFSEYDKLSQVGQALGATKYASHHFAE